MYWWETYIDCIGQNVNIFSMWCVIQYTKIRIGGVHACCDIHFYLFVLSFVSITDILVINVNRVVEFFLYHLGNREYPHRRFLNFITCLYPYLYSIFLFFCTKIQQRNWDPILHVKQPGVQESDFGI